MDVKTIAVIGAGTMGRGIAYAGALGGFRTVMEDLSDAVLGDALGWMAEAFEEGVNRGKVDVVERDAAMKRITTSRSVEEAIRDAELVIEAVDKDWSILVKKHHRWAGI